MGSSYAVFDLFAHTCICGYTHQVKGREREADSDIKIDQKILM